MSMKYFSKFNSIDIDTIILACTHYPMLLDTLKSTFKILGHSNLNFIESGNAIVKYLSSKLSLIPDNNYNSIINSSDEFYITDTSHQFNELANRFLGANISNIELINL